MARTGDLDLEALPVLDQHAHPAWRPEHVQAVPYPAFFTEAQAPECWHDAAETLFFRRSVRDLAELLECEPTVEAVVAARNALSPEALARRCLHGASLSAVLLDDGLHAGLTQDLSWHARFVPTFRILRLEAAAEDLLMRAPLPYADFVDAFRALLEAPGADVLAFKTIAAYRCGLRLPLDDDEGARSAFATWTQEARLRPRLTHASLIGTLLRHALEVASRRALPVQVHCGLGDPDLDLREASPLHLRPVLEDRRYAGAPIVLLHAAWPYVREAAWLAAVYPQVHVDLGLAIPFLSVRGMHDAVAMLLETAPTRKLLYSSDSSRIPELSWLGARWGRRVLGRVLRCAVDDGDLAHEEAEAVARDILGGNAARLHPGLEARLQDLLQGRHP